jgi:hypothetical protein
MNKVRLSGIVFVLFALLAPAAMAAAVDCTTGGQLGPCLPLIHQGVGAPSPGSDPKIGLDFHADGSYVIIDNPWTTACGGNNIISFYTGTSKPVQGAPSTPSAYYGAATRFAGSVTQTVQISSFDHNGDPVGYSFNEYGPGGTLSGDAMLYDDNNDTLYEHLVATTGSTPERPSADASTPLWDISFIGTNGYISIPFAQASMLGLNKGCDIGGNPQIFVPMVGSRIVIGFPGFLPSPPLFAAPLQSGFPVPTLSEWGLIGLMLSLGFAGWRLLRRRRLLA